MEYPKYSVLMAVYVKDSPDYLTTALDSMVSQTVGPDEIILVEDGPLTSELYSCIANFKAKHDGILKTVVLETNGGLGRALNAGLHQCRNELIARMDSDDISLSNRCEKQLQCFMKNNDLDILGTQIYEFVGMKDNIVRSRAVPCTREEIFRFARRRSPFNHPTVIYKKSVVLSHGGYHEYGRKEDLDLFLRMVFSGCNCQNLEDALLLYRTDEKNLKRRKTWKNCSEYISIMWAFFKSKKIGLSDISYVVVGQLAMFLCPSWVVQRLSNRYLRTRR